MQSVLIHTLDQSSIFNLQSSINISINLLINTQLALGQHSIHQVNRVSTDVAQLKLDKVLMEGQLRIDQGY